MALDTPLHLRDLTIYSIFTRNFSEAGTFEAVADELDRIKALGTDVIWFLPFYPIGEAQRKGAMGSPYAIKDYRAIDADHGSKEDFQDLVDDIHERDMKVMIDIVFNHTAPDADLVSAHPEWFHKKEDGSFGNKVGDWTDIIDLDYEDNPELWDHQIETLVAWAKVVDGFRCDVAGLIPIKFWKQARAAVNEIKPDFIWLAETNHRGFIQELRRHNIVSQSDAEVYQAFDLTYDYDVGHEFREYLEADGPLSKYVHALNLQETHYPANYVKLKILENHDHPRFASIVDTIDDLKQWTAFYYLQKGATLIYNGQEVMAEAVPNLFEKEPIDWDTDDDLSEYMAHLGAIKKEYVPIGNQRYVLVADDETDTVTLSYMTETVKYIGVFNLKQSTGTVTVEAPDGEYSNLISNETITIKNRELNIEETPVFFKTKEA